MALQLGDIAPDFEADTTEGRIRLHEWLGDSWGVLFSHPKDFTPICTTELGYMARIKPEFDKRNVKIIGLSIDPVEDHQKWANDIKETQGAAPNYPMIGDPNSKSRSSTACCRRAPPVPRKDVRRRTIRRSATCS
jgi:alkyl hydroperoxide reductase subunit AhpC